MALHILMRTIGVFVVATVCFFSVYNGTTLFTFHPVLMSAGVSYKNYSELKKIYIKNFMISHFYLQFILLMTEAIISFSSHSFVANNLKYNERLTLHWMLQLGAAALIGLAFFSVYSHKNKNNYDHFASRHASLGLTTCLMMAGTTSGGIAARYSSAFRKSIKPALLKIIHSTFGVITYTMAIFTLCFGLDSEWFRTQSSAQLVTILTYAVGVFALLALITPLMSIVKKVRNSNKSG